MPAKFTLISNVSDFGLFKGIAKTRTRLLMTTVISSAILIIIGFMSAQYILEQSSSVILNLLLITCNMILIMTTSYLVAMALGDLFFKGPWREQVILKDRSWHKDQNPDVEIVVHDHNAEFLILWALSVVAFSTGLNLSHKGFLGRYHEEGYFQVRYRSNDPSERLDVLRELSDPLHYTLWHKPSLRTLVLKALNDPDPKVMEQASWNSGKMKIKTARERLISMVKDAKLPNATRGEAAVALGRLQENLTARETIEEVLLKQSSDEDLRIWMLRGLAMMKSSSSQEAILKRADTRHDKELAYVFWAMRSIESTKARAYIRQELDKKPTGLRECVLLDTLKMVSTKEDINWVRQQYINVAPGKKCARLDWMERDERRHTIVFPDSYRVKFIKIIANSGHASTHSHWFQRIINDRTEEMRTREVASDILLMLKRSHHR